MLKNLQIHYVVKDEECEEKIKKEKFDDLTSEEKLNRVANIHTHGLEKYGFKNICTTVAYDMDYASWLLNAIAETIVGCGKCGEDFDFNQIHCFDTYNDENDCYEELFYVRFLKVMCCDEMCYLVILSDFSDCVPNDEVNVRLDLWAEDIIPTKDTYDKIQALKLVFDEDKKINEEFNKK